MKKILLILCSVLISLNLFSQEIIIVDSETNNQINYLEVYKNYSQLLKDYLDTGNEESLKEYSLQSRDFYSPDNYNSDLQVYMVGESIFYWNYLKPQIDKEDFVKVIDGNIISFWTYLIDNNSFKSESLLIINFGKSYSKILNSDFIFTYPVSNFDDSKLNLQNKKYKVPLAKNVNKALYNALSQAEGMQKRFEKNKIAAGTEIKLSDSAFISMCNSPDLLYVIINNSSYSDLFQSYLKTLSSWLNLSYGELGKAFVADNLSYKKGFIIFPDVIYEKIYPSIPIDEKKDDVITKYQFSYYFTKFALRQLQEGFALNNILSENELDIFNLVLEDNYAALCLDDNFIFDFINKIKLLHNFDYFNNIKKLNSVVKSGK